MSTPNNASGLLFTVVEPFLLSGSILHVVANITDQPQNFDNGERVQLRRPDGKVTETKCWLVRSTPDPSFAISHPNKQRPLSFYLEGLSKEDVPSGTQVWKVKQAEGTDEAAQRRLSTGERHSA
ncbi:MAG: hypothetical protein K8F91_22420 [Candidatus Obscuribacterales bacterium]|nr:hypothetical protein [Candidatus Obscuribacterales bacterium]